MNENTFKERKKTDVGTGVQMSKYLHHNSPASQSKENTCVSRTEEDNMQTRLQTVLQIALGRPPVQTLGYHQHFINKHNWNCPGKLYLPLNNAHFPPGRGTAPHVPGAVLSQPRSHTCSGVQVRVTTWYWIYTLVVSVHTEKGIFYELWLG